MSNIILEEMLDDENDIVVDDVIDGGEIDFTDDDEEEDDGAFSDIPVGVEYDEEEDYEDPYIMYDGDEEEEPVEDEDDEEDFEDEDFFVNEAVSMDEFVYAEQYLTESLVEAVNEAGDDEAKKQAVISKAKEMRATLEKFGKRGYNRTKIKEERNRKQTLIMDAVLTASGAVLLAVSGVGLPFTAAFSAFMATVYLSGEAIDHAMNKKYNRIYTKSEINKIKSYAKKAYKCSSSLNKKAESEKDAEKAKRYKKTAEEYKKLAKEFDREVQKSQNTKKY